MNKGKIGRNICYLFPSSEMYDPSVNPFDDVSLWYDFDYKSQSVDDTTKL